MWQPIFATNDSDKAATICDELRNFIFRIISASTFPDIHFALNNSIYTGSFAIYSTQMHIFIEFS